jgi:lipoate---protein ligase
LPSRFIVDGAVGAYASVALEEAILVHNEGLVVRVWGNEKSVIIGRAQLARYETDVDYCAAGGIPIVRRITAGGAVYNGPGNLNWSLFVSREFSAGSVRYVWDVHEVFRMGASLVTRAVERCGVRTWLVEPNRIVSAEGKVSGMAAYISRGGLLCHGTLLLDADLEEARRLTEPSKVELERRYTRSNPAKVANTGIRAASFMNSLMEVVAQETGAGLETSQLRGEEMESMRGLLRRYKEPEWSLGDPFTVRTE